MSSGGIIAIIILTLFILILLLLVIIFIIVYCSKKGLDGECKRARDCKSGLICYQGKCKVGLGEDCDNDGECAGRLVCIKGVCKKKKRRQIDINKNREIEINTVESSSQMERSLQTDDPRIKSDKIEVTREEEKDPDKELHLCDVCNYSKYTIYLMTDNSLIVTEGENSRDVKTQLHISHIINFNGYLHAIGNGKLYYLDNNTLETNEWEWKRLSWSPHDIIDMSVPHDKTCIWLRTKSKGYLYDHNGNVVEKVDTPYRRVYGTDKHNYVSFDNNGGAIIQPGNRPLLNAKDCVFDHKGELFILETTDKRYRMMKLVDWKPFYIP